MTKQRIRARSLLTTAILTCTYPIEKKKSIDVKKNLSASIQVNRQIGKLPRTDRSCPEHKVTQEYQDQTRDTQRFYAKDEF